MTPYYDPATAESEQAHYLAVAADLVQRLAPAPDPLPDPDTYSPRAARAERLLLNYLTQTKGGTLSAKGGIPGAAGSKTFASEPAVRAIVKGVMGDYYTGGGFFGTLTVASSFTTGSV
jgi:hypothetical protein